MERAVTEGELAAWIRSELRRRGAPAQAGCIVAIGPKAADPHYDPGETGEPIRVGRSAPDRPVGRPPRRLRARRPDVDGLHGRTSFRRGSPDIWHASQNGPRPRGGVLARPSSPAARRREASRRTTWPAKTLAAAGYGEYFIHRTGHSIDRELHGRGPNLDNLETRDDRVLVPGVGFSVEPGVYVPGEIGLRTEINVFMGPAGPEVTVDEPQEDVFLLLPD